MIISLKNKMILTLGLTGIISAQIFASEKTDKTWKQELKIQGIEAKDQSYCYTDEDGISQGSNLDMRVRLASVSKLLTSLWAVEKLGVDHKFNTKLYIKGDHLHIEGSYDPFMFNEKMFFLVSQLNELGYFKFDTITFDKNLIINPDSRSATDDFPKVDEATMAGFLKKYFNTESWSLDLKNEYLSFYKLAKTGKFRKEVQFEVKNFKRVGTNPFADDTSVRSLTLTSPFLFKYLKEMNVKSHNYVSEMLFRYIGGISDFALFLNDRFNLSTKEVQFFTGSGLPAFIDGVRRDNYATCGIILNLVAELKETVEKQGRLIEDVVAVPGSDGGTFRSRIFPSDYKNSFVAKTGTLMHTSTLAGAMNTKKGFSFFGIFNQSTDIAGSKTVQNAMVKSIMTEMGGPLVFEYTVEPFHPYNDDNVKTFEEPSEFSSIEEGLY